MSENKKEEFIAAIRAGDKPAIEGLLKEDPGLLGAAAPNGSSAILLSAYYGHPDLANVFIANGAKLDIYEASTIGDLQRVRKLVDADPESVNSFAPDGFYPLGLAAFFGHPEIVLFLLDHGAQVGLAARNSQRVTALHGAVARRDVDIVKLLLEHGADPNARQERGFVPLHEAAAGGKEAIVHLLVEYGGRIDVKTDDGKTPYDLAVERGQGSIADWLKKQELGKR
jgi:ankyrin repeat protein